MGYPGDPENADQRGRKGKIFGFLLSWLPSKMLDKLEIKKDDEGNK